MGLLDNYTGIGDSPRPTRRHQQVMGTLYRAISDEYDDFEVLTEFVVDDQNLNAPAPDVLVYSEPDSRYPALIIEITSTKERKAILEKAVDLLNQYRQIEEALVYDYQKEVWYKVDREGSVHKEESYSDVLDDYLDRYL